MSSVTHIPRIFDFPEGRLEQRRDHLLAMLSAPTRRLLRAPSTNSLRALRPGLAGAAVLLVCLGLVPVGSATLTTRALNEIRQLFKAEAARDALPDTQVMSVFQRAATPSDQPPAEARARVQQFAGAPVPDAMNTGNGEWTGARRAIVDAGPSHSSLYLIPTDRKTLCMIWVPDIGAGCIQGFQGDTDVIYDREMVNSVWEVWGILRDNVTDVEVVVNGKVEPTTLGESAFYFSSGATPASALFVTHTDGSKETIDLGAPTILR